MRLLTKNEVLMIHKHQIETFGGAFGIRDFNLLESAVAQPASEFGGVVLHDFPFGMAAAYLFHISSNHPFVDGNKRVGLACALVFLDLNGFPITTGTDILYDLTMATARGERDKAAIAAEFERLAKASQTAP